jgi:hypothetical protein
MNISRAEQSAIQYNQEQYRLQKIRQEENQIKDYQQKIDLRNLERTNMERVRRNIRLDSDKGRQVDLEC